MQVSARQKQRNDTSARWSAANPVLLTGEIGIESNTGRFKVGDGVSRWSVLGYFGAQQAGADPAGSAQGVQAALGSHTGDAAMHITAAERAKWNGTTLETGSYSGTGAARLAVTLGYQPRIVWVYALQKPACEYSAQANTTNVYAAKATDIGVDFAIERTATGFAVFNSYANIANGSTARLNVSGQVYAYIVCR